MTKRDKVDRQIDRLSELPIISQVLIKLNEVAEDDSSSAQDLSEVILRDQGLTLRMLKVVNSSYYGKRQSDRVTTISKAVVILGFNGVRRLALGMSVFDHLKENEPNPAADRIWNHSLLAAITSRIIAERVNCQPVEEAFVAGLVHDMGKLILMRCDPEEYSVMLADSFQTQSLRKREKQVFGITHVQAGRKLAKRWGLPSTLIETIADHHANDRKPLSKSAPLLLRVAVAANQFSHLLETHSDGRGLFKALVSSHNIYGIDAEQLEGLYEQITSEYRKTLDVFNVDDTIEFVQATAETLQADGEPPVAEIDEEVMLNRLQAITEALINPHTTDTIAQLVLEGIQVSMGIDRIFLLQLDETGQNFECRASIGCGIENSAGIFPVPVQEGSLLTRCAFDREKVYVPDTSDSRLPAGERDLTIQLRVGEFALIPLLFMDRPLGMLWVDNQSSRVNLTEDQLHAVGTFANSLALALGQSLLAPVSTSS